MGEHATLRDWLSLARFKNIVIGGMTVGVGAFVANPIAWSVESVAVVALQMIAVASFMLAGNVGNDMQDVEIDRVSHPLRVLPSGTISIPQARVFMMSSMAVSVLCVATGSFLLSTLAIDWIPMLLIWLASMLLMITYEVGPVTKNRGFIGNIVIGSMIGVVIVYGAASVGEVGQATTLSIALMATFMGIGREVVKDVHDLQGDLDEGRSTLPMKIGAQPARNIAYLFALAGVIAIGVPFVFGWDGVDAWLIVFMLPCLLKLLRLNAPLSSGDDATAVDSLLMAIILGLGGVFTIALVRDHLI